MCVDHPAQPLIRVGAAGPLRRRGWPALAPLALALLVMGPGWSSAARAQGAPPAPAAQITAADAASESLQALLARVLEADPQVRVARLLAQVAEERRVQARSRLGPSVTLSGTYGRSVDEELGLRVLNRRTQRAEAGLRWNLVNGGADLGEFRAASREVMAALEEVRRAREEASGRIAEAYVDLLRSERLLPRAHERLDALQRLAGLVERQVASGKVPEADAQQAQTSLLDAQAVLEQLQADAEAARERLNTLAGGRVGAVQPVQLAGAAGTAEGASLPRPGQVLAAQQRAAAARLRVLPPLSLLAPRVDLEYRHQLSDETTPALTTEQRHGWVVSARWEVPLGGETLSRRAEGEHRAQAAEAEAERVLQGVQSELVALGPRIAQAQRATALFERQVGQYDQLVRAAELQFEAGRRSLAQLMQLHDSRFMAEQRRADAGYRLQSAQLRRMGLQGELLAGLGLPAN